jgi:hypothetical protein
MFQVPERFRVTTGRMATSAADGNNGFFVVPSQTLGDHRAMQIIASDGEGWEHVSVCVKVQSFAYTPLWDEMCMIKDAFWGEEDVVMQLHPRKSNYVNFREHVLHLWRPVIIADDEEFQQNLRDHMPDDMNWPIPEPPTSLVGPITMVTK